jgi:uncharacterized small protein (DUF1192 family)
MFDEESRKKPKGHEVGMPLDAMSVEELNERITMLRAEIGRLEQALAARQQTRAAADQLFTPRQG